MKPKPKLKTSAALKKARVLLAKGWTKGTFFKVTDGGRRTRYCAAGAVKHICKKYETPESVIDRDPPSRPHLIRDSLGWLRNLSDPRDGLMNWNDAPSRKKSDVLNLFDEAIMHAEAAEKYGGVDD